MTAPDLAPARPPSRWASPWVPWAAFAVLYATSFASPIMVLLQNSALQIPLLLRVARPGLLPEDAFTATLGGYASPLWYALAPLARVLPLEPLLLGLLLCERALAMFAFGRLAGALTRRSPTAIVAGWFFAATTPGPFVAGGTIVGVGFEQTGVAVALGTLAIAALFEGRCVVFGLLLGLTFDANPIYGVFTLSYVLPIPFVVEPPGGSRRAFLRAFARALAVAALVGAPALLLSARAFGQPFPQALWLRTLRGFHALHFFPDQWSPGSLIRFGLFVVAARVLVVAGRQRSRFVDAWLGVLAGWLALAVANAYLFRLPGLFVVQPGRGGDIGIVLVGVSALAAVAARVEAIPEDAVPRAVERWSLALALGALPLAFFASAALLVCVAGCLLVFALARRMGMRVAWPSAVQAVLAVSLAPSLLISVQHGRAGIVSPAPATRETARWAQAHTDRDAVFLIDPAPEWDAFRVLARRRPFVTWKEGAAFLWRKDYVSVWTERMALLGWDVTRDDRTYHEVAPTLYPSVDDARVRAIRGRHRLDFWVLPSAHPTAFPVVFEAAGAKIVALGTGS